MADGQSKLLRVYKSGEFPRWTRGVMALCVQYPSPVAKLCNETWIGKSVVKHCQNSFEYFMRFLFFFSSPPRSFVRAYERKVSRSRSFLLFHEGRQHVLENDEFAQNKKNRMRKKCSGEGWMFNRENIPPCNAEPSITTSFSFLFRPLLWRSYENVLGFIKTADCRYTCTYSWQSTTFFIVK